MGTVMLSSSSSSSQHMVFHRLLRPASILSFSFFKQSLSLLPHQTTLLCPITINNSSSCFLRSRTFSNLPVLVSNSQALLESTEDVEDKEIAKENGEVTAAPSLRVKEKKELPSLTGKEKKELASYAHSLGKKLKSQQVGKSGVTDSVIFALDETLEANELLKLKIHGTCPGGELDDVVKHLEEATGSVVVGQIGRTVILYRPSVTKLKAEEKKKQAQNAFMRKKQYAAKQSFESKGQVPRPYARGRRGSSRV
ncbi:uncharacterized protein LOC107791554 [Nicotiana tabacum]|uniref:Uncharacterized protein LOC107791554 n=1 Tax=Nicotiana tabacum TaxID=4097 RepID=A0A1S3ZXQ5_TOBAC|nr:uncharacterized protein LOC104090505 isoform X2 [Nicotiana tomentosiformis]XP_016469124.1 PREDICTED: uncharacterized protein LOC107791554 [Nicotiana tabacum]